MESIENGLIVGRTITNAFAKKKCDHFLGKVEAIVHAKVRDVRRLVSLSRVLPPPPQLLPKKLARFRNT